MQIECPYCGHRLTIGKVPVGVHSFRCKGCNEKAYIRVPEDPADGVATGKSRAELEEEDDGTIPLAVSEAPTQPGAGAGAGPGPGVGGDGGPVDVDGDTPWFLAAGRLSGDDASGAPPPQTPKVPPAVSEPPAPAGGVNQQMSGFGGISQAPTGVGGAGQQNFTQAPTGAGAAAAADAPSMPQSQVSPEAADEPELSGRLNGYEIDRVLGRGGMGSVYLATQLSLDRPVAIKVLLNRFAQDPVFLARFTREAYAAAQLTHHNIVQIYDIGEAQGVHFFSMEFVRGRTLLDVLKQIGRLDVEEAAGYILQAARGLRFAHDHGMIHRDVKPENLILNDEGVVKVADLGLVKTTRDDGPADPMLAGQTAAMFASNAPAPAPPSGASKLSQVSNVTHASATMGTPAYMAPEQAIDAARVDGRADIYSLGCVFYALTTGRPVFEGATAAEVITKHKTQMIVPPDAVVERVPQSVSAIIQKMLAKNPNDRFQSMRELIRALEQFLGIASGPFTPKDEHVQQLQQSVSAFNSSILARVRRFAGALAPLVVVVAAVGLVNRSLPATFGVVLFGVVMALTHFVFAGIMLKSYLFRRVRQFIFGLGFNEWAVVLFVAILLGGLIWSWGLAGVATGAAIAGVLAGLGAYFALDLPAKKQREPHVHATTEMLKTMRMLGLEEDALRRFVCKYSGKHWEEFYEELFGFEAKIEARRRWGEDEQGKPRPRFAKWRERIVDSIDERERERQEMREFEMLEKIEKDRLRATGYNEDEIDEKAEEQADRAVWKASQLRDSILSTRAETVIGDAAGPGTNVRTIYGDEDEDGVRRPKRKSGAGRSPVEALLLGSGMRMIAGLAMLGLAGYWMYNRNLVLSTTDPSTALNNADGRPVGVVDLPMIPENFIDLLCSHGGYFAGLVWVVSAFFPGRWLTLETLPGIAIMIAAPMLPIPTIATVSGGMIGVVIGAVVAIMGLLNGQYRR